MRHPGPLGVFELGAPLGIGVGIREATSWPHPTIMGGAMANSRRAAIDFRRTVKA